MKTFHCNHSLCSEWLLFLLSACCCTSYMILKNCLGSWKWNKSWSQSHTVLPSQIIVLLFTVCICCRLSTVKSCNIFAKIFIHQPGLRHCRVNEQQLLTHSKWILPARYPTWAFLLFFFLFYFLSEAFTFALQVMLNMRALPPALNSLSGNGLFCFTVKTTPRFPGRGRKKNSIPDCFWGKYNLREKTMLLNALSYPRQSWWRQGHSDKSSAGGIFIMCC